MNNFLLSSFMFILPISYASLPIINNTDIVFSFQIILEQHGLA